MRGEGPVGTQAEVDTLGKGNGGGGWGSRSPGVHELKGREGWSEVPRW